MSFLDNNRSQLYQPLSSQVTKLDVRQHPLQAVVTPENKEKMRKPIDPPPIVQLMVDSSSDPGSTYLVNPFLFMTASLVEFEVQDDGSHHLVPGNSLIGQSVSSLHRLKDVNNKDGGFFVFGDISCRRIGKFRLLFSLFEYRNSRAEHGKQEQVEFVTSVVSRDFTVVSSKDFRGLMESTHLSRTFSDQGVRLRLRKEPRSLTGSKRSWDSSPVESHTSPTHYSGYGSQVDYRLGYPPPSKRQRSETEHEVLFNARYGGGGSMHPQYNATLQSSGPWPGQIEQIPQHYSSGSYSGLTSRTRVQPPDVPFWQTPLQPGPQSTPAGGSIGGSYFESSNIASTLARNQASESFTQSYGLQSGETYSTGHGLQTPTSGSDNGLSSQQQHNYLPPASEIPRELDKIDTGQWMAQPVQPIQPSHSSTRPYNISPPSLNPSAPRYPTVPSQSSSTYARSVQSGRAQTHYQPTPNLYPDPDPDPDPSRDTFSTTNSLSTFSDSALPLNSGMLNRAFTASHQPQQQPPYGSASADTSAENLAEFKPQPQAYPTPSQTSPLS